METPDAGIRRALALMRAFRAVLLSACLVIAGIAWTMEARTIIALALVIAAEEAWETSVVVAALRHQLRSAR